MLNNSFNTTNDYFIRYLFTDKGNELILLNFINSVMQNAGMKTFKSVEILNPFNLKNHYDDKETIVDVKCLTQNGHVVLLEIQTSRSSKFSERILYYWALNYSKLLKEGVDYSELSPVISINLLNLNLEKENNNAHSCYMLYDTKRTGGTRLLTDHLQIHILELKKFNQMLNNIDSKDLSVWFKFFTTEDLEGSMSEIVKEIPIMEEVQKRYNNFIADRIMMTEYERRELYLKDQRAILEYQRQEGRNEGIAEGRKEGRKEEQIAIAKNMKNRNIDIQTISDITSLSIEEIENL